VKVHGIVFAELVEEGAREYQRTNANVEQPSRTNEMRLCAAKKADWLRCELYERNERFG
jgi:hypothetical protein